MNENVVITDKKKIEEIRKALKTTGHFDIKPAEPDKLPENAKKCGLVLTKPKHYAIIPLSPANNETDIILHSDWQAKPPTKCRGFCLVN